MRASMSEYAARVAAAVLIAGFAGAAAAGCDPKVQPTDPSRPGGAAGSPSGAGGNSGGAAGGSGGARTDAGFGFAVPDGGTTDAGPGMPPPGGGEGQACAEDTTKAAQIPVDLLLLVDSSSSMNNLAGTRSKWSVAVEALQAFVRDPRSAGIGMGLQFFPHPPSVKECMADADCATPGVVRPPACLDQTFCVGGTLSPTFLSRCAIAGPQPRCPGGAMCVRGGLCSVSKRDCAMLNQPCPGGMAGDVCQPVGTGRLCGGRFGDSCDLADYERAAVPIAGLPGNQMMMLQALSGRTTSGTTPTGPAIQGAINHLRKHQAAHPDRRVALVLTTDGFPTSCGPIEPAAIAEQIRMAHAGTPSIPTYVIGVFTMAELMRARMTLDQFATAGGTGMPFVLTATDDLAMRLQDALAQIRGSALPCEFAIPPSRGAGMLDYGKVNVKFKGAATPEETIPYVERAERCDPMRGGWYYDVHPMAGMPTRVIACEASCRRFKMDQNASVSLSFGCATKVIE